MPVAAVLHEGNAVALVGVGNDAVRAGGALFERRHDFGHRIAVDLGHVPAEGFETRAQRRQIIGVLQGCALLEAVVVDDQRQIVEAELGGGHDGFQLEPSCILAVARQHEGAVGGARKLGGLGHADGNGQAVAERAGVGLDTRNLVAVRVAVEARHGLQEGGDFLFRKKPRLASVT